MVRVMDNADRGMAALLGGDHGSNINKLLRTPGGVNWPNTKKTLAGRVACMASILAINDREYALSDLPVIELKGTPGIGEVCPHNDREPADYDVALERFRAALKSARAVGVAAECGCGTESCGPRISTTRPTDPTGSTPCARYSCVCASLD